jgi:GT2 family glycosyltransferase
MDQIDISIVIVNYNSGKLLSNCLKSIRDKINCSSEVIIVDNNSNDNSFLDAKKTFENSTNFIFHNTNSNLGFALANNIGFELSRGRILHFLNPDTQVFDKLNEDYTEIIEKNNNNTIYVNTIVDSYGNMLPSKNLIPLFKNVLLKFFKRAKVEYWYTGASIIIWRDFFIKIDKWPIEYFMYSEDMDFFYSSYRNDGVVCELTNPIMHIGGGCSTNTWGSLEREIIVQKSFKLFFKKHNIKHEYYLIIVLILFYKILKRHNDLVQFVKAIKRVNLN